MNGLYLIETLLSCSRTGHRGVSFQTCASLVVLASVTSTTSTFFNGLLIMIPFSSLLNLLPVMLPLIFYIVQSFQIFAHETSVIVLKN